MATKQVRQFTTAASRLAALEVREARVLLGGEDLPCPGRTDMDVARGKYSLALSRLLRSLGLKARAAQESWDGHELLSHRAGARGWIRALTTPSGVVVRGDPEMERFADAAFAANAAEALAKTHTNDERGLFFVWKDAWDKALLG